VTSSISRSITKTCIGEAGKRRSLPDFLPGAHAYAARKGALRFGVAGSRWQTGCGASSDRLENRAIIYKLAYDEKWSSFSPARC